MSNVKKIAVYLFVISFFFTLQNVTSAAEKLTNSYGIKITEEEYENLKELGFTDLAIDQMNKEVFKANKDLVVDKKSESTKYYEIVETTPDENQISTFSITSENEPTYTSTELSKEEYFRRVEQEKNGIKILLSTDTTTTSYRRLTTSIQLIGTTTRLHSKFIWDIIPATRSYDVLSTAIDSTFSPKAGSEYGQQLWGYTYTTSGGFYGGNATYPAGSSTYTRDGAGYGVKMDLKNDTSNTRITQLEGYMYYNIARSSSVVPYYINAYGNYSHLKTTDDTSFSYGLDFGGPGISWSGISASSFDSISAHAQILY